MRAALSADDAFWQHAVVRAIRQGLNQFAVDQQYVVACSGGRDSMLLVDILAELCPQRVRVIHVHHGLQSQASQWARQVADWCATRGLDCQVCQVTVAAGNLEAQARIARYQAFAQHVATHECVVLAHHQQDQAETVLMRLLKGSGVQGLAAMSALSQRQGLRLWRPMLGCDRALVTQLAEQRQLPMIDDPANQDQRFDRVYLRQVVWPVLGSRWQGMQQVLGRVALLMQDAAEILSEVAQQDLRACQIASIDALDAIQLQSLSPARQRQVVAVWMQADQPYAPPLQQVNMVLGLLQHRSDARAQVDWSGWRFQYYQAVLYRTARHQNTQHQVVPPTGAVQSNDEIPTSLQLQIGQTLTLPSGDWAVVAAPTGLPMALLQQPLWLKTRVGGERLHLEGRVGRWPLKKFLQMLQIPPWQRDTVQLLMVEGNAIDQAEVEVVGIVTPKGFFVVHSSLAVDAECWRLERLQQT
ncbi:MAG: tRNA lysidine(34) synthetase TilS [Pseudomonadota bacterium]|nr:tRNA lysidine(34) synthetase TilS [Pseudomonadota bacterium]